MIYLICSIFAFVFGFCAGSMRALDKPEVKRLNKLYWETQNELDTTLKDLDILKKKYATDLQKVRLELLKLKKETKEREKLKCQISN